MKSEDLIAFWRPLIDDAGHGWSIGTLGASAEFHRTPEEPAKRHDTAYTLAIATDKGGMRLIARDVEIVAFDNLDCDGDTWSQSVAFCVRFDEAAPNVIVPLGIDNDAIRPEDRAAHLYDIGVGLGLVRMCVRTTDAGLVGALDGAAGQSLYASSATGAVMHEFFRAQPHRVMLSPAARIEVYQDIPQPDGDSPEGPHTHLLPKLLAKNRTHSANTPIPDGLQSVLYLHPHSPLHDSLGKRTSRV